MRWLGARDDTIQLSTIDPMVEPMKPPMAASEKPRMAPPNAPPIAEPTAPRTRVATCIVSIFGEEKSEGDLARPCWGQDFLDHTEAFIGVDEAGGCGQDPDMLGDGARSHPEQDQRSGWGNFGFYLLHHRPRAFSQNLARPGLAPIPAVGRDREWLIPDDFAPDAAREADTQPLVRCNTRLAILVIWWSG